MRYEFLTVHLPLLDETLVGYFLLPYCATLRRDPLFHMGVF